MGRVMIGFFVFALADLGYAAEHEGAKWAELNLDTRSRIERKSKPSAKQPDCLTGEPGVQALVAAAWEAAGLLAEQDASRQSRVRLAGWLPKLSGGVSWDMGDRWDYRYEPGEPRVDQLQQDDGLRWDFDLSWDLTRAVYNSDELAVEKEALRRAAERRQLAAEVVRLFFARRALLLEGMPEPQSPAGQQIDETSAILDAWTGGRFAARWCGRLKWKKR